MVYLNCDQFGGLLGLCLRGSRTVATFFSLPLIKVEFNVTLVHNCVCITFAIFFHKCNSLYFVIVLLFGILTLVIVTDKIVYIYFKASLNIRTVLIIFCQYFYGNNNFDVRFNVCLFKRVTFDVM